MTAGDLKPQENTHAILYAQHGSSATRPRRRLSLLLDTDRTFSHWIKLRAARPPSGGVTSTCQRTFRSVRVIGMATTSSAGPSLNRSTERIRADLAPACSWPMVDRSSDPIPLPAMVQTRSFLNKSVSEGLPPEFALFKLFLPRLFIAF
jgi:hypothetical protein